MELRNWLLLFGCASKELRVFVYRLADWIANPPPPPWDPYHALMACRLVALDKRPGFHPVQIGETLRRALAKLVTRAAGDQAKISCGNLQLCAVLEAGIEGTTYTFGYQRLERVREQRGDEEKMEATEGVEEEEEEGIPEGLNNFITETAGTEEAAAEGLTVALGTASQDMEVEEDRGSEGEDEGGETQRALGALEFRTQEAEPSGNTLIDARNGFNKLSHLEMLWTVQHRWTAGVRFAFNCHRHWAQLLLRHPGEPSITILSREGVTQGDPLSMVLYGITLTPLAEELKAVDLGLLSPFYTGDAVLNSSAEHSAQLLKLLTKRRPDQGYFLEPDKSLFILDTPGQEEAAKQ